MLELFEKGFWRGAVPQLTRLAGLAAFEMAWNEVLAEHSAADPTVKRVADSYLAFRKVYKTWGDAQALEATYLRK